MHAPVAGSVIFVFQDEVAFRVREPTDEHGPEVLVVAAITRHAAVRDAGADGRELALVRRANDVNEGIRYADLVADVEVVSTRGDDATEQARRLSGGAAVRDVAAQGAPLAQGAGADGRCVEAARAGLEWSAREALRRAVDHVPAGVHDVAAGVAETRTGHRLALLHGGIVGIDDGLPAVPKGAAGAGHRPARPGSHARRRPGATGGPERAARAVRQ
jgi:hypothetical protein